MHDRFSHLICDCNVRLYGILLHIYSPRLQRDFRDEMLEVFRQQLSDEYSEHGWLGISRVWSCVIAETPMCILDFEFPWRFLGISAIAIAIAFVLFSSLIAGTGVAKIGIM